MRYSVTRTRAGWNVQIIAEAEDYPNGYAITDGEVCVYDPGHLQAGLPAHDRKRFPSRIAERAAMALRETGQGEKILRRPRITPRLTWSPM